MRTVTSRLVPLEIRHLKCHPLILILKYEKKTTDNNKTPKRNHCHTLHEENLGHTTFGASSNLESVQLA